MYTNSRDSLHSRKDVNKLNNQRYMKTPQEQKDEAVAEFEAIRDPAHEAFQAIVAPAFDAYLAKIKAINKQDGILEVDAQEGIIEVDGKRYKLIEE